MNIFVLAYDPYLCAEYHTDKHVVKMVLETAQILSTAVHSNPYLLYKEYLKYNIITKYKELIYKPTHINHPVCVWARKSRENYLWLYNLGRALSKEYTYRYNKYHKSGNIIVHCGFPIFVLSFPSEKLTQFPQCMPAKYKIENDPQEAYRNYYKGEKKHLLKYTKRDIPHWLNE